MKMRLIVGLIFMSASLACTNAYAEFKVQCHQGGNGRGADGVKPDAGGSQGPDQVTGAGDGNDHVVPNFGNQSLDSNGQNLTPEERKARRAARRQAILEKLAALKTKLEQYIQANAGANGQGLGSIQGLQTAFEEIKRGPAGMGPASVTPSSNYETIIPDGGVGAAH